MQKEEIYKILEEQYFGNNPHERAENEALRDIIDGTITQFVDVGASLGQYTKTFSEMAKSGKVISIEADPVRYERLVQNAKAWTAKSGVDIRVHFAAASDNTEPFEFFTSDSNISGSGNILNERSGHWRKIEVPAVTLDTLLSSYDNTLIKMDIEGGEFAALMGAAKLLKGNNNVFLVELHVWGDKKRGKKVKDVLDIFSAHGYTVRKFHGHYMFDKKERCNKGAYRRVAALFKLKEIVYFSPLRGVAQYVNQFLKQLKH